MRWYPGKILSDIFAKRDVRRGSQAPPPTAKLIVEMGINWTWYQIEDRDDAICFRLHQGSDSDDLINGDFSYADGTKRDGEVRCVQWETFPPWGAGGKFKWVFERYGLGDDAINAAVVTGKPMRKPREIPSEEKEYLEERSKHFMEKMQGDKS